MNTSTQATSQVKKPVSDILSAWRRGMLQGPYVATHNRGRTRNEFAAKDAKGIGLLIQAERYAKDNAETAEIFADFKMSDEERSVWFSYCDTHYDEEAIKTHFFKNIPPEIIRHWLWIKNDHAFDRFQVWNRRDCEFLLIGFFDEGVYLLARWREKENTLPHYELVKDTVLREKVCFRCEGPPVVAIDVAIKKLKNLLSTGGLQTAMHSPSYECKKRFLIFTSPITHCGQRVFAVTYSSSDEVDLICRSCGTFETVARDKRDGS